MNLPDTILEYLKENSFTPSRISVTNNDSRLYQFLKNKNAGALDIYPNGDIVFIVRVGEAVDNLITFENVEGDENFFSEVKEEIVKLFKEYELA